MQRFACLITACCFFIPPLIAQNSVQRADSYLYYKPLDYGSQSLFNPWYLIMNGSYDVLQLDGKDRRIFKLPYRKDIENVLNNAFVHPAATIEKIGWDRWISTEILPLNFTPEGAQWLPNYQLHVIGGGMSFRMLEEWYDYHEVAFPTFMAATSITAYHLLNEAVENDGYIGDNIDPIADLLFFDGFGIVLFSYNPVANFFSHKLQMADWSNLLMITYPEARLSTNGLYYSIKVKVPNVKNFLFWHLFGTSNMFGFSYRLNAEHSISMGAGARGSHLTMVEPEVRMVTIHLVPTGGIFWDKNNSLMASLTASGQQDQTVILNLYPGVIHLGSVKPAIWTAYGSNGSYGLGMAFLLSIGIGYADR